MDRLPASLRSLPGAGHRESGRGSPASLRLLPGGGEATEGAVALRYCGRYDGLGAAGFWASATGTLTLASS